MLPLLTRVALALVVVALQQSVARAEPLVATVPAAFGAKLSRTVMAPVVLTNIGDTPVLVRAGRLEPEGPFRFAGGSFHGGVSVAPGNSLTVSLVYDPLWSEGTPTAATLVIDTDAGELVIPLSATTRAPARALDVRIVPDAEGLVVLGGLSPSEVLATLQARSPALSSCADAVVPSAKAVATVKLAIDASGRVTEARAVGSTRSSADAEACLLDALRAAQFPEPAPVTFAFVTVSLRVEP